MSKEKSITDRKQNMDHIILSKCLVKISNIVYAIPLKREGDEEEAVDKNMPKHLNSRVYFKDGISGDGRKPYRGVYFDETVEEIHKKIFDAWTL